MRALALLALLAACSSSSKHEAAARTLFGKMRGTTVFDAYVPATEGSPLFRVRPPAECEVATLPNGEDSFAARMALLAQAKRSILIQALIFTGDESGLRVAEVLKQKRAEGLDVRVIVDAVNNISTQTQWMYFDLEQHGIVVEGYEPAGLQILNELVNNPNMRYHEKLWIVDGVEAVTGGLNIANEYFRIDPANVKRYWRDQDVLVRGPVVDDLVATFERNWQHFAAIHVMSGVIQAFVDFDGPSELRFTRRDDLVRTVAAFEARPVPRAYQPARCLFLQSRPRLAETYIQQAYLKLLASAKTEVLIANAYFVPTHSIRMAIKDAASRCVRVVLIGNSPETNDTPGMSLLGRGYYQELLAANRPHCAAGVEIYEWIGKKPTDAQQTQGLLHAKYAVADRTISLVGSYNLDPRSERLNSESAIVYESAPLAGELASLFEQDLATSRRITAAEAAKFEKPSSVRERFQKQFAELFEDQM